jgi:hypothetical protein
MSDRIIIDHIRNNITIQVHSTTLTDMNDHDIFQWITTFIHNLENGNLIIETAGDNST